MVSDQHKTGYLSKKTESEDFPWLLNKKHEKMPSDIQNIAEHICI